MNLVWKPQRLKAYEGNDRSAFEINALFRFPAGCYVKVLHQDFFSHSCQMKVVGGDSGLPCKYHEWINVDDDADRPVEAWGTHCAEELKPDRLYINDWEFKSKGDMWDPAMKPEVYSYAQVDHNMSCIFACGDTSFYDDASDKFSPYWNEVPFQHDERWNGECELDA